MSAVIEARPAVLNVPSDRRRGIADLAAVSIPAALALLLCLYELTTRSLWLDESATVAISSQHGAAFASAVAHDGGNMAGYYALMHLLIGAFGNGPLVIRLPSALATAGSVALVSILALRLFDRRMALVSGLVCAVSLPLVYWGQDARGYTLMVAFVCASFLVLVVSLQQPRGTWPMWVAYVLLTSAAVYAGLVAVLILPAQLAVLAWHRRHAVWLLSAMLATLLCCIPLAIMALDRGSAQIFWIPAPNAFATQQVMLTLTSGGLQPQFYSATGDVLRYLTEVLIGVAAGGVAWQVFARHRRPAAWPPVLALSWALVPLVLTWVISELGHSLYVPRYLLISLPGVALLLAWLIVGIADLGGPHILAVSRAGRSFAPRRGAAGAVVLLTVLLVLRALQVAPAYGVSTEPWKQATADVLAAAHPGDCIAFYPQDTRMPFRYYLPSTATPPRPVLPTLPWHQVRSFVEDYSTLSAAQAHSVGASCNRVWLISSHQGQDAPTAVGTAHYKRFVALTALIRSEYRRSSLRKLGAQRLVYVELFSGPRAR